MAVFDLDRTLLRRPVLIALAPALHGAHLLRAPVAVRTVLAHAARFRQTADDEDIAQLAAALLRIVHGWSAEEVRSVAAAAAPRLLPRITYRSAWSLLDTHRDAGDVLVVASSAPADLVVPIAKALGVHAAPGSMAHMTPSGHYSGKLDFLCRGRDKAQSVADLAADLGIDLRRSFAYSDSVSDLPLFDAVGTPVATNPERRLHQHAVARSWTIARLGGWSPARNRGDWPWVRREGAVG